MVAVAIICRKTAHRKFLQLPACIGVAAGKKCRHRLDAAIDPQATGHGLEIHWTGQVQIRVLQLRRAKGLQVRGQQLLNSGSDGAGGILGLGGSGFHRHQDIALHLDHRAGSGMGHLLPPLSLVAQIAPVADQGR